MEAGSEYNDRPAPACEKAQEQLDHALFAACLRGDLRGAQTALEAGAGFDRDTSVTEVIGHRALHVAASAGNLEVVCFLLANGAACDPRNEEGHTPVYLAAVSAHARNMPEVCNQLRL